MSAFPKSSFLAVLAAILGTTPLAWGVILDPSQTPPADWTGRPTTDVVGKYGSNASLVVVAPDYALTTNHQGTGNATVNIGGTTYFTTDLAIGGPAGNADMRILKIFTDALRTTPASLSNYVALYNDNNETNLTIALGGYGRGTGTVLTATNGKTYGYQWDNTSSLQWAGNKIEGTATQSPNELIWANFDIPGSSKAVDYEGTIAEWDSGGGWFNKVGNTWAVLGLSRGVTTHGSPPNYEAWIRDSNGTPLATPDQLSGVRVSSYASWVQTQIVNDGGTVILVPEPASLTLLGLSSLVFLRRRRRQPFSGH